MFRWVPPIRFHIAEILGWYIPRGRILRFERFLDVKKGHRFVWICHDCHEGVVVPGSYINIHGEEVKIDPKNLEPDIEVISL